MSEQNPVTTTAEATSPAATTKPASKKSALGAVKAMTQNYGRGRPPVRVEQSVPKPEPVAPRPASEPEPEETEETEAVTEGAPEPAAPQPEDKWWLKPSQSRQPTQADTRQYKPFQPYQVQTPMRMAPRDVHGILYGNPDRIGDALAQSGAANAGPPVIRASHLMNKYTGVILPWNSLIAEQRDLMVPCDEHGNTDPSAWADSVIDNYDDHEEQETLYWKARQSVTEQAMRAQETYAARDEHGSIPSSNRGREDEYLEELKVRFWDELMKERESRSR